MNTERLLGWVMWTLAVVVPGGLVMAALWYSFKAAKQRSLLASQRATVQQVG